MHRRRLLAPVLISAGGLAALIGSLAFADPAKETKPGEPAITLPPGWTEEDMKACILAGTPGKQHELLAKGAGKWQGQTQMWMAPGSEATQGKCAANMSTIMDGRYLKCDMSGEMPGMGAFTGLGFYGYDNVSGKFVSSWIDNQGTGILYGTGELSADGKVLTWKYSYNCPIAKKAVTMREVETMTSDDSRTLEFYGPDPKSGKEYKMMRIELTRKKGGA